MRFAIFGTGGFARELVLPAREQLLRTSSGRDLVFVSDKPDGEVMGLPHIPAEALDDTDDVVIAVGDSATRKAIAGRIRGKPGRLVAASAVIGPDVDIGEGAVFCAFTTVTASARIGRHFQCNIYSYVAHDCVIGDYVTFAPKVACNGNVVIEDEVYIGTGALLRQGKSGEPLVIGRGAIVGMGAVVTKNVPAGATVIGNPARILEKR